MSAEVDNYLTEELKNEYSDIYPLLWLIYYRTDIDGRARLLEGEWDVVPSLPRRIGKRLTYIYELLKSRYDKSKPAILMSECFWDINRYDSFMNEILDNYNVIGTLCVYMCNPINLMKLDALRKKVLRRRVMPVGQRLVSYETKAVVAQIYDMLDEMKANGSTCADCRDKARSLFEKLRQTSETDINKMTVLLKKYNVEQFVTINEYNLPDYITILACKRCGIRTKEMFHYWVQEAGQFHSYGNLAVADQHMYWNDADRDFSLKYEHFVPGYQPTINTICGCPEVTTALLTESMEDIRKRQGTGKTITLLVPNAVQPSLWGDFTYTDFYKVTPLAIEKTLEYWEDIFREFKRFEENSGYKVLLRFHPTNVRQGYVDHAQKIVEKYGFEQIPVFREGLFESIKRSDVIFSFSSSSLYIGYILGCKCYCLDYHKIKVKKDFSNLDMQTVPLSELHSLVIPEERDEPRYDLCIDAAKVFEL